MIMMRTQPATLDHPLMCTVSDTAFRNVLHVLHSRVPVCKWSCDPTTESSLSVSERAHRTSFKSEWSFGDVRRPAAAAAVEDLSNHTESTNCPKTDRSRSVNADARSNLQTENVQRQIIVRTAAAVCVNLAANGSAAGSSSALRSEKSLSCDAVTTVDDVPTTGQWNSVDNSAVAQLGKKEVSSVRAQGRVFSPLLDTGCVKCNSSGQASDVKDTDQLGDRKTPLAYHNEIQHNVAENERGVMSQKECNCDGMLDKEESVGPQTTAAAGVLSQATEAVVDELVSEVAQCEDVVSTDGSTYSGHREIAAATVRHDDVLDAGDSGVPVNANAALLETDQDGFNRPECSREVSVVGALDDVGASTGRSHEVHDLSSDCSVSPAARSHDRKWAVNSEDAKCHPDKVDGSEGRPTPDRHSVEKQRSDIANGIDNLQSWIDGACWKSSQLNDAAAAADGGGVSISLGVVEQYAGELQKRKSELGLLNAQVKELEKCDKSVVVCDERHRLVSIHTQLHHLSATLNGLASEMVRIGLYLMAAVILSHICCVTALERLACSWNYV